jgi:short-subunit dehydrogenase
MHHTPTYAASKTALLALANGLRAKLADRVDVSVLCPSLVQSYMGAIEHFRPAHMEAHSPIERVDVAMDHDALELSRIAAEEAERGDLIIASPYPAPCVDSSLLFAPTFLDS